MFVASFYCYLKYDKNEFVIDLDNIWKWLGFSQKCTAKRLLEKNFKINIDYKFLLNQDVKQDLEENKQHGGYNKETYILTIKAFKLFCLYLLTKNKKLYTFIF